MGTSLATATVALFTTTGCNFFFGLEDTKAIDGPRPDSLPFATLQFAVPKVSAQGAPDGLDFIAIPMIDGAIRIGPAEGELAKPPFYDAATGRISLTDDLVAAPWRLEYTLEGIVYEILWQPARDLGRAVVTAFGGPGRPAMPTGATYAVTPTRTSAPPAPTSVTQARAFTTGVWGAIDVGNATAPVPVDLGRIAKQVGGTGRLDPATDQLVLASYVVDNGGAAPTGCTVAGGAGVAPTPDPSGPNIAVAMPWTFQQADVAFFTYQDDQAAALRLMTALGTRDGAKQAQTAYGFTADVTMPAFVADAAGGMPRPALVELARCPGLDTIGIALRMSTPVPPQLPFAKPADLARYPRMAHLRITNTRASSGNGPGLTSGIAAVAVSPTDSTGATPLALDLNMPFAEQPRLDALALDGAADQLPYTRGATAVLTFGLGTMFMDRPDYLEVTLYRVVNSPDPQVRGLFAERVYMNANIASPRFAIAAEAFEAGTEYVFALRAYRGRPGADAGDFTRTANLQTVTTVFTRTFVAQ